MDGFHFSQALNNLTTKKNMDVLDALNDYVKNNDKDNFIRLCNEFIDLNIDRKETIENKRDYILNNWKERQLYQNNSYMKCSMESHISHIFADLFTSRPKSYSKSGLKKLLQLRLLKVNGNNIKQLYFNQLLNINTTSSSTTKINNNFKVNNIKYNKYDVEYKALLKNKKFLYN